MPKFKIVLRYAIACLIIVLPYLPAQSAAAEKLNLTMGWEAWPPFAYKNSNGVLTGFDIDIVTHILSNAGHTVTYREVPWARLLRWIEDGTIHIAASAMKTSEREAYAYFSAPYQKEAYVLFVRKGEASNYKLKNLEDIIGTSFRMGVMRNSLYGEEFYRLMKNPEFSKHVEEVTTDEMNHKKLLAKRFDGFIQEYSTLAIDGKKTGIFEQVEPLLVAGEGYLHVMFSKKAVGPEFVDTFNDGLKKMQDDGTYKKLFQKYDLDELNMIKP